MTSCHLQYSFTSTPLQLATHHLLLTTYYSLPITTGAPPLDASGAPRPSRVVGYCSAAPRARASAKVLQVVSCAPLGVSSN